MTTDQSLRGSLKVLRDRWGTPLGDQAFEQLSEILDRDDIRVTNINCFGQPNPDVVRGSFTAGAGTIGPVAKDLFAARTFKLKELKLFPKGIPWPEIFNIDFEIGQ